MNLRYNHRSLVARADVVRQPDRGGGVASGVGQAASCINDGGIRRFVQEPAVWVENQRKQREQQKAFRAPLLDIFRLRVLGNTVTACLWMASGFVFYYGVYGLFATHLQRDLHFKSRHGGASAGASKCYRNFGERLRKFVGRPDL